MRIHFPDLGASYVWPWKQIPSEKPLRVFHLKINMNWQIIFILNSLDPNQL
jgi:hypothetical protein